MPDALTALHAADALHQQGQYRDAITDYRRAVALDPTLTDAWYGFGCASASLFAYGDAIEALRRVVQLQPDAVGARCNLADALFQLGQVEAAVTEYQRAAAGGDPEVRGVALSTLACIAPGCQQLDHAAVRVIRQDWAAAVSGDIQPARHAARPIPRKLRIGYVSAFFGARNWMKPIWGVINRHDRDRFEIHLLSDGGDPSAASGYADHPDDCIWPTAALSNAQLAEYIRRAGLDVLVDLNGYSRPARLPLFLHRPAPRQIAWFNMYATSGLSCFDALVGDAAVVLPEEESHYSEPIVRVPGSYLAFEVRYPVPEVAPPPSLRNGRLTFGSFASAYKLTDAVVGAWARILLGAPGSRLVLRNQVLDDASSRATVLARLAAYGVMPDRVTLRGSAEHFEFLRGYDEIDIALDPFPYNGGTTTTEALWQGVPVLTFNGDRWASRTSRSLLLAAGLPEWVAADEAALVARAIGLALDPGTPAMLAQLRGGMRQLLRASAACDCARLCAALEALYDRPKLATS